MKRMGLHRNNRLGKLAHCIGRRADSIPETIRENTMNDIRWTEALSVGNEAIDDDHRHLFDLLDQLQRATPAGLVTQEVVGVVDELVRYTENHFRREEEFMQRVAYPAYPAHKIEHERFVSEVHALQSRLARGAQTLILSIDKLLSDWLRQHVLVVDKALAEYLRTHH